MSKLISIDSLPSQNENLLNTDSIDVKDIYALCALPFMDQDEEQKLETETEPEPKLETESDLETEPKLEIEPELEIDYETVHAISFNKENLENILDTRVPKEYKEMAKYVIKPINVVSLIKLLKNEYTSEVTGKKFRLNAFGTNNDLLLMHTFKAKVNEFKNKMFAFNEKLKNGEYLQSIIIIAHDADYDSIIYKEHLEYVKKQKIFKNNISDNPIEFDVYYDEGIINA
jgi:hypothetical protein